MPSSDATDLGRLPYSFSIVGVQKAGTSTLSAVLQQHPHLAPSPTEVHFFDTERRCWDPPDYSDYTGERWSPEQRLAGDKTPSYIFHPYALTRMRDYNPDMRLIALFRDPLERLFSHWLMIRDRWEWVADWPEYITQRRARRIPERFPPRARFRKYVERAGVARGLYGQQVERGLSIFPREQWLFLDFREMLRDTPDVLDRVTDHLGVDRFGTHPALVHKRSAPAVEGTAPTADELHRLAEHYADDVDLFGRLSGLEVSQWPVVRILGGELDPGELARDFARKLTPPTGR